MFSQLISGSNRLDRLCSSLLGESNHWSVNHSRNVKLGVFYVGYEFLLQVVKMWLLTVSPEHRTK